MLTPRENARLVLNTVSPETPTGRAARQAAADVMRLSNVRAIAKLVLEFEWPQEKSERLHPSPRGEVLWRSLRRRIEESE